MSLVQYILWYELWTLIQFDGMKYKHWRWFHLWVWVMEVDDRIRYELWRLSVWIVKLDDGMNYEWTPLHLVKLQPRLSILVILRRFLASFKLQAPRWYKLQYIPRGLFFRYSQEEDDWLNKQLDLYRHTVRQVSDESNSAKKTNFQCKMIGEWTRETEVH